jgi:hypothetical protein
MSGRLGSGLVLAASLAALAATWSGCAESDPTRLRLRVVADTAVAIPAQVDWVRVWVVASRTSEGSLCTPTSRDFVLTGAGDLPLYVDYYPGGQYDFWVAFRVEWYRGATLVAARELIQQFPAEGMREAEIRLQTDCVGLSTPCNTDEQCLDGLCVGLPPPGPFASPELIDTVTSCDPDTPAD